MKVMNLSERLVSLRKQKGLTQMELAEWLNVSRQAVSRWEVGTAVPGTDNLQRLASLYEVSVDYLLNDGVNQTSEETKNHLTVQEEHEEKKETLQEKTKITKRPWILAGVLLILLVISVMICLSKDNLKTDEQLVSIEDMAMDIKDDYEVVTFPLK